ncbi:MAG: tRNA pseudouridine(13) synthase TruD [Candidatus Heimdallarchaeota archaeon]|nr:tRNA pseudouridine(13) synthase TruD [Candidatus Heimdallarchaeota archaeon]
MRIEIMCPNILLESHPIEKIMGIQYYSSSTEGIGGKLRNCPEDFIVEEILPDGRIIPFDDENFKLGNNQAGLFTEFILIKRDIESHRALLDIARALQRPVEDIKIAGTKDKSAYTSQKATIWRVKPEELLKIQLDGITIRSPRTTIYQTYLGNLLGNHFRITIRKMNFDNVIIGEKVNCILNEIKQFGGLGNYFGHQRFGSRRPISHEVGKKILQGNIKDAIWTYLTKISENEHELTIKARKTLLDTNNYTKALDFFSKEMIFEKIILRHLIKQPNDYLGAFKLLPKNLQKMFIHSYQSYIWNSTLSKRIEFYGNLLPHRDDIIEESEIVVPIIGSKTDFQDNIMFEFIRELLEKDNITKRDFDLPKINWLKFTGSNRRMVIFPENFSFSSKKSKEEDIIELLFSLGSGSYATIILREFMKVSPILY